MKMNQSEQRSLALSAVRAELRRMGVPPETVHALHAHQVLDDLARSKPDLIASQWYASFGESQIVLFYQEWDQWREWYNALSSGVPGR